MLDSGIGFMVALKNLGQMRRETAASVMALILCLFAGIVGAAFIPLIGIENDEAFFGMALFPPFGGVFRPTIGHSRVTLMLVSYTGSLKAWLYWPVFRVFGTGLWTLRLPMVLAGAASVWLVFLIVRRAAGKRAAIISCSLLATDATYLLTNCFDWGPVALQHLLLAAGCWLLVRFCQERSSPALFWGFFLCGLAEWDKALAAWMLSGIGAGALVVFSRQLRALITKRRLFLAGFGFLLGSMPLLFYNAEHQWATFRGNFSPDTRELAAKARALVVTAQGDGLFGWMFAESADTSQPREAAGRLQAASARLAALAGHPRRHLLIYAFVLALVLMPLARGRELRILLLVTVALAVAWTQMAVTKNAGGALHHTILLWPLPQIMIGIAFATASRKLARFGTPLLSAAVLSAVVWGALVANEYYVTAWRYGASPIWTDGVLSLSKTIQTIPAQKIYCVDWGILDPLRILTHGALPLSDDAPIPKSDLDMRDLSSVAQLISNPEAIFVGHTAHFEAFPGVNSRFLEMAAKSGYKRRILAVIRDSFRRPAFEVYQFTEAD
jgi:hypothetical protein